MLRAGLRFPAVLGTVVCAMGSAAAEPDWSTLAIRNSGEASGAQFTHQIQLKGSIPPGIVVAPAAAPVLPERKPDTGEAIAAPAPAPDAWSPEQIAEARARCTAALKRLNASVVYEEPIKDGDCGDPAPISLTRLGNVTFTPAARINCGMLVPLDAWISKNLQRSAMRQLGARITTIEVMSDYSCRTALGRVGKRLSQHAYLDALDIRGFITNKGDRVHVLDGWGSTERDIAKAKAKEEQIKAAAQEAAKAHGQAAPAQMTAQGKETAGAATSKIMRAGSVDMVNAILPGANKQKQSAARLGGPPDNTKSARRAGANPAFGSTTVLPVEPAMAPPPADPKARFLREAHASACKIFGTTLGPEANEMHRNHFHVDMAQRKIKNICK